MNDLLALLDAAERLARTREEAVLVTLVHTEGSTYRRPGARMLVLPGCRTIGTISGGCLEPAVAREAWDLTRSGKRTVFTSDSGPEDETWGPASGCHGRLFLLAEPIAPNTTLPALNMLRRIFSGETPAAIIHEFHFQPDGRLLPAGTRLETPPPQSLGWHEEKNAAAFCEVIEPRPHLLICGAGDDARPLARLATELGWRVDILDSRGRLATPERFPSAHGVSAGGPAALASVFRQNTAVVLMSHRFTDDVEYIANLPHPARYLGILGPRRRTERLLAELAARHAPIHESQLSHLFSPVGLDIGSAAPETIALAILAEIQAVLAARDGRSLSAKTGPIHTPAIGAACPP
jgi:xanthine/CO dehydrogenase XdhC/CoxF family maturation factor